MKNKICVYAICKNESKFVEKWLDNMSEADYIVVLDTGSTDDTFEKLKNDKRVTKVEQKIINPWRFDVARNESMKLIPEDANVLVCTDFDELFNPGWANVIRKYWNNDFNRFFYQYAWSHTEIGEPTNIFKYDKIHTRDFIWKYPVHEVLTPINPNLQIKALDVGSEIFLHHYQDISKSRSNYFDLLQLGVRENPDNVHERMLLAREYLVNNNYQEALENYLKALKSPNIDDINNRLVLLESLIRCADCYYNLKNYDEALWYCQEFIKEDATYREPYFIMAVIYNEMKMYTLAEYTVLAGLKYSIRKYNWIERENTWISDANDILSICYYHLNDLDKAIENIEICLDKHPNDVRLLNNYSIFLKQKLNSK